MQRRRFIERQGAADYVLTVMVTFAASVLATRIFLELTGYPQLGNSELHIAHVLWGGLIVAVGSFVPLIYGNRWIYGISATLTGIGLGLFFDEVGKFLTQDNDYFFRPAASIIYILFLIGIYVATAVRRGEPDSQTRLHHALDMMQEIVDGDFEWREKRELVTILEQVKDTGAGDVSELASALLTFVQEQAAVIPDRSRPFQTWWRGKWGWVQEHILTRRITRWLLMVSIALLSLTSLVDLASLLSPIGQSIRVELLLASWTDPLGLDSGQINIWSTVMVAAKIVVGMLLLSALLVFAVGFEQQGVALALSGLLLSITLVDVLLFYFEQFETAIPVAINFALIVGLKFYSHRHLESAQLSEQKAASA